MSSMSEILKKAYWQKSSFEGRKKMEVPVMHVYVCGQAARRAGVRKSSKSHCPLIFQL